MSADEAARRARAGVALGLGAYLVWGFLPLLFKALEHVLPLEIVAQRVVWSVLLMAALIVGARRGAAFKAALANPRAVRLLAASATLIAANWLLYIWAVINHHVLETSLGYFLNPLVNVVMGVLFLKERLTRAQTIAVGLAGAGVAVLAAGAAGGLWISLGLALSFASYGLIRKVAPVESMEGLAIETMLLAPFAIGYLLWLQASGGLAFGDEPVTTGLLVVSGAITAIPLLLFAAAARRLRFSTLGLLQYLAPTIQFLLAVLVFGEPLTLPHILCFAAIWTGLAIYAADGLRSTVRRPARGLGSVP